MNKKILRKFLKIMLEGRTGELDELLSRCHLHYMNDIFSAHYHNHVILLFKPDYEKSFDNDYFEEGSTFRFNNGHCDLESEFLIEI